MILKSYIKSFYCNDGERANRNFHRNYNKLEFYELRHDAEEKYAQEAAYKMFYLSYSRI